MKILLILLSAVFLTSSCTTESESPDPNVPVVLDGWTKKADFSYETPYAKSFTIGGKGYILTGSDLWEYDPGTNEYNPKTNFPGPPRLPIGTTLFTIGNKAYYGFGQWVTTGHPVVVEKRSDFWEYDPETDIWTQKSDFPRSSILNGMGISIGEKGYVIGGYNDRTIEGVGFVEVYEYDPAKDEWTKKSDLPTKPRVLKIGFGFSDKGYVGVSEDFYDIYKDFWEYNPATDKWTERTPFPTFTPPVVSFTADGFGYTYGGELFEGNYFYTNDVYEYNPATDEWKKKDGFPAEDRNTRVGFGINSKIYIGMGRRIQSGGDVYFKDLWEYTP